MLAAFPQMMNPLPSSSIQIKAEPSDLIARKRRRGILQSNRAAKTICTGAPLSTSISNATKDTRISTTTCATSSTRLPPINNPSTDSTAKLRYMATKSKMPPYCGSAPKSSKKKAANTTKMQTKSKSTCARDADNEEIEGSEAVQFEDASLDAENLSSNSKKKPQMRYDPSVPMTKEAAAVWRREQRRKRNRDSAAASRQRQRNRISELEDEVAEWKIKFDSAMVRLAEQEQSAKQQTQHYNVQTDITNVSISTSSGSISELMPDVPKSPMKITDVINNDDSRIAMVFEADRCSAVSPYTCPSLTPDLSHIASSDMLSLSCSQALRVDGDEKGRKVPQGIKVEQDDHQEILRNVEAKKAKNLNEISRPA